MIYKYAVFALVFIITPAQAFSAVTATYTGAVTGLRVEGTSGLISMATTLKAADGTDLGCARVWEDLNSFAGRTAYSTAMMAFSMNKTRVLIRGQADVNLKRYGACIIYDIFVPDK